MATAYNDTLVGTVYDDYIDGGDGDDILLGGLGSDIMVGGNGNDALIGYGGNTYEYDYLHGGYGSDYFFLGTSEYGDCYVGDGYAVIQDFSWLEGDKFVIGSDVSQYSIVTNTNILGSAAFDTAIYKGDNLLAIVQDTTNVSASDFIVV